VTRVAVCIVTNRASASLQRTLLSVVGLDGVESLDVRIVVVDNGPAPSAQPVIESIESRFPVEYVHEARAGIPFARNTAVERAGNVDLVAFIDDDEWAEPRWLAELVAARSQSDADIVVGPVLPEYESSPPSWVRKTGYFEPLQFEPLAELHFAYTGNVLIKHEVFDSPRPFREELAQVGGSDTHFFMRAWLSGRRIVWAPEARVHEAIPEARMRAGWIVRREYRRGATLSLCLLDLEPSLRRRVKRVGHGLGRVALGLALTPLVAVRGRAGATRAARNAAFGAGLLMGLTGRGYPEYGGSPAGGSR
jgi:succinoglycan biosynthesis protein ExoM